MKVWVAVPVYDSKLQIQVVQALMNEQIIALANGDLLQVQFTGGNAGIVAARNQMAYEFMRSDFDRLFFLDADITFEPGELLKLAKRPEDVVAGGYRYKAEHEAYPIRWLPDPDGKGLQWNDHQLLEVEGLPTGFMAISRNALATIEKAYPGRALDNGTAHPSFAYFQMPFIDGVWWGEDYFFCKEWRDLGGKVYLDPMINLTHWSTNPVPHAGHIGNWLKRRTA